jgi:hypothetical protein
VVTMMCFIASSFSLVHADGARHLPRGDAP